MKTLTSTNSEGNINYTNDVLETILLQLGPSNTYQQEIIILIL